MRVTIAVLVLTIAARAQPPEVTFKSGRPVTFTEDGVPRTIRGLTFTGLPVTANAMRTVRTTPRVRDKSASQLVTGDGAPQTIPVLTFTGLPATANAMRSVRTTPRVRF